MPNKWWLSAVLSVAESGLGPVAERASAQPSGTMPPESHICPNIALFNMDHAIYNMLDNA